MAVRSPISRPRAYEWGRKAPAPIRVPPATERGGAQPTVTDANLFLGRIDPDYFLRGNLTLDTEAAGTALAELGNRLALDRDRLAPEIIKVINAKMSQGIRTLTVERGIEPREFSLVAFEGPVPCTP